MNIGSKNYCGQTSLTKTGFYDNTYLGINKNTPFYKMTGCFLVISEAVVSMCLKNNIENFSVKLYHSQ